MPWKGVTVSEVRQRFLEDYKLRYYSVSELSDRFDVSRRTAHKWIRRFEEFGQNGFHELSRRPYNSPSQTDPALVEALVALRKDHPTWGARKLLDLFHRRHPARELPVPSTVSRILAREGLARSRRRFRRAHPGCPKSVPHGPNDIWAADYKGQFRLKNGRYCFPLTVSDLASRYLLGVDAHPAISLEKTQQHFTSLFQQFGLPNRIRTANGVPFASSALARLSSSPSGSSGSASILSSSSPVGPSRTLSTRGCTAPSSRRPPSLPLPACEPNSTSSTTSARSSTSSGPTKRSPCNAQHSSIAPPTGPCPTASSPTITRPTSSFAVSAATAPSGCLATRSSSPIPCNRTTLA